MGNSEVFCGCISLWGVFQPEDWSDAEYSKYRDVLYYSIQDLNLGQRFTFQQDNNPKHTIAWAQLYLI